MKKIYCNKRNKYRKFKNLTLSQTYNEIFIFCYFFLLVVSIEILKTFAVIDYINE